ncbi:hypothetical protein BHF71_08140 [Vulcanibacillus modesticaldus]|uniref:DUF2508 domain-containing protein n=1 Tax=Vulcanibacillus modesticaldus TaxID=337097 RepID=A0A1D2YVK5_9BACI|nr:DUF2508 family protein [Vulcanibacillus modesticaldus]OEF99646.1 hypothetical protein BHF71_08140 [Vulcanibacillus modesticaldus]
MFDNDNHLLEEIDNAKKEWEYALRRFNDVSDPEVVDYIIFYILAAERRYMYLLNKYKDHQKRNEMIVKNKQYKEIEVIGEKGE